MRIRVQTVRAENVRMGMQRQRQLRVEHHLFIVKTNHRERQFIAQGVNRRFVLAQIDIARRRA